MRQVMVRYKVKPERVEENEALVRAVYEELAAGEPDGIRYATFRLDDGVSFYAPQVLVDGERRLLWGWTRDEGRSAAQIAEAIRYRRALTAL